MFNASQLQWQMNSARQQDAVRGEIPDARWPDIEESVSDLPLSLEGAGEMSIMVGLAIGALRRPLHEYLNPVILKESYQAAYRLLFARYMVDVLQQEYANALLANGSRSYATEAVYMVPGFTYLVEGLLGLAAVLAVATLVWHALHRVNLAFDPGPLAASMTLVANDATLLRICSSPEIDDFDWPATWKFCLSPDGNEMTLITGEAGRQRVPGDSTRSKAEKSFQAWELSGWTLYAYLAAIIAVMIALAYVFWMSHPEGLPLPSEDRFVRQMLENYLPTILATLIDSVWVSINRIMCIMQPLHELRKGSATAKRSINANYLSLPPQLVFFPAAVNGHFILGSVCVTSLLANILAVALGASFKEQDMPIPAHVNLTRQFQPQVRAVDGWYGPWNQSGGAGFDQFYVAMSNLTSETPMPVWTDDHFSYSPLVLPGGSGRAHQLLVNTTGTGASLQCYPLSQSSPDAYELTISPHGDSLDESSANISVMLNNSAPGKPKCSKLYVLNRSTDDNYCPPGPLAMELISTLLAEDSSPPTDQNYCRQLVVGAWVRNTTQSLCGVRSREVVPNLPLHFSNENATVIACLPTASVVNSEIALDASRTVVSSDYELVDRSGLATYFSNDPQQLILQANNFLIQLPSAINGQDSWHNDTFPSDWDDYMMAKLAQNSTFLDPTLPAPRAENMIPLLTATYQKLFAIWFSLNRDRLLNSATSNGGTIPALAISTQTRVNVSKPMVILDEALLAMLAFAAIAVHLRKPSRFLACKPESILSVVSMFAASHAVRDMQQYTGMAEEHRNTALEQNGARYGYATFVGTDSKNHRGVELSTRQESSRPSRLRF